MHQPGKWWPGLVPLAAIWAIGTGAKTPLVEADLTAKARTALASLPAGVIDAPAAGADGRDIHVAGLGLGPDSRNEAARIVDSAWGVRRVEADLMPIPAVKPWAFSARRLANQMVLSGYSPPPPARARILAAAAAAAPGALVADGLKYATGAPAGFEAMAAYALGEAGKLVDGSASISDGAYSISGAAPTSAVYEAAIAATKNLPAGLSLAKADISPPEMKPYSFSATRAGQQVTLAGAAPSPEARAAIAAAAAAAFPGLSIANGLQIASGAPQGDFTAMATHGLTELGKLSGGAVALTDKAFSISGAAPTPAAYEAAMAATRQLPQGLTLAKADIQPAEVKPYAWSATRDGNGVTLAGFAPDEATRAAIAAKAASAFPGARIDNELRIARGAPAGDFAGAAGYALAELGKLAGGTASMSDAAYSISGNAATSPAFEAAMAGTRQLPAGLSLAKADIQPPEAKPYLWSASNDGKTVTLAGSAPSLAARDAIAAAAAKAFPGLTIANQMQIARGAPAGDFPAAASFALAALGRLADGKAQVSDGKLSLAGTGKAGVTRAILAEDARGGLPQGFSVAAIDLKEAVVDPYVFKAEKADGKLRLTGYFPDEKTHAEILSAATSRLMGDTLDDNLARGGGAPKDFVAAVVAGLDSLARLANGQFAMSGAEAALKGAAFYENAAKQIMAAFAASMPAGVRGAGEVTVSPPGPQLAASECQPRFSGLLAAGRVQFETASAKLHRDSTALLDHVVGVALRCRDADIEVAGHTDSDGAPERNLALSKRRAQSVIDYLVEAGVDASRITAAGYGETRPIASNDTAEGKAQNRRIEMSVK